jgi:hypothetical protein
MKSLSKEKKSDNAIIMRSYIIHYNHPEIRHAAHALSQRQMVCLDVSVSRRKRILDGGSKGKEVNGVENKGENGKYSEEENERRGKKRREKIGGGKRLKGGKRRKEKEVDYFYLAGLRAAVE